jgi:hypothetical protein
MINVIIAAESIIRWSTRAASEVGVWSEVLVAILILSTVHCIHLLPPSSSLSAMPRST